MDRPHEIPAGLAHFSVISAINTDNRNRSESLLSKKKEELKILGIALSALYCVATCARSCRGGDHILEALAARIYNLSCAAYSLVSIGFYDEALSLVRSIGEIGNLLSLSVYDKKNFEKWIKSTKRERIRSFSPAKVRTLLEDSGLVLMDKDWYANLCESYTHITPQTKTNSFNEESRNVCGGVIQERGISDAVDQLSNIVGVIALFYCKYFDLDDYFESIVAEARIES